MWELLGSVIPDIYRFVFPYAVRIVIFHIRGGIIGYWPHISRQPYQAGGKGVVRAGNTSTGCFVLWLLPELPIHFVLAVGLSKSLRGAGS